MNDSTLNVNVQGKFMNREPLFENVMHRLKSVFKIDNDKALAGKLGMSPSAFANRKSIHSIPYEQVIAAAKSRNMSLDWVFLGRGEPYDTSSPDEVSSAPSFNVEGALVDPGLLGLIFVAVERKFDEFGGLLEHDRLSDLNDQLVQPVSCPDDEANQKRVIKELGDLLTERRVNMGMVAGMIYNQVVKYKIKSGPKQLKFINDEAHNLVHMMSLMKNRVQPPVE
jgi:hypothetical protein